MPPSDPKLARSNMDIAARSVAVIPCLNEAATIAPLVAAVRGQLRRPNTDPSPPAVIVVDDGSADGTARLAETAGARVLRHDSPRGKGAALQLGLREAVRLGFEWALLMDGDGQHNPADIPSFLDRARVSGADLVVGNRMSQARAMPWLRRHVNRWMSQRLSRLAGQSLPDSQCGFRLVNLRAWSSFTFITQHFEIESEMLLQFAAAGRRVEFVPIQVIYKSEQSKIHPWRDTGRWFRWLRGWPGARPKSGRDSAP